MPVLIEKSRAFLSMGPGLDGAKFSGLFIQNNWLDVLFIQDSEDILAALGDQAVGEKVSIPNNYA
jgi:hypothetical protein